MNASRAIGLLQQQARKRPSMWSPALLFCLSFLSCPPISTLLAEDVPSSVPAMHSARLSYRELGFQVMNWGIQVNTRPKPYKKEPDLGGVKPIRGTLNLFQKP